MILVIRGGAIGDFILTLPVLAALRQQFPQARLELLGYAHIAQLALAGGLADAVRSIEARSLAGFFARAGELDPGLQVYFASCSVILSYLYDPDRIFQENVARCSRAQFVAGPHRPPEKARLHATAFLLQPLERLAIFQADPVPRLRLQPPTVPTAPSASGQLDRGAQAAPILAAHPGSGSEQKNWPESSWEELLRQIVHRTAFRLLLVGGEAEAGRLERLAAALPPGRIELACHLPLTKLAAKLNTCAAFLGHDSGISHLAAALGVPSLILWGDTVEEVWRPQGERLTILRHPQGLDALPVQLVLEQLLIILSD